IATNAEQIVRSITDPDQQARALTALAQVVAASGEFDHAEQIARSITHPNQQARALTALVGLAEPTRARSLVANALAVGRWTIPLKALARVDAKVLFHFVDKSTRLLEEPAVPEPKSTQSRLGWC
ncbi:hypothetical protein AB0C55_30750, partial [Micromonospora humida]